MFRFFKELKRRNVHKRAISYVVFSWLVVQVIATMASLISLPDWLGKTTLIILCVFFPIWLTVSWFYDITPSGIKKIETIEGDIIEEQNVAIGKRLNIFILVFLSLAVVLLIIDRTRLVSKHENVSISNLVNDSNSIAVLPFRDISVNKDQAYFADGLAEELISMLSKISNIKVTSRTSAFSFKDKKADIPTIAKQLGVNYILEGSVRTYDSIVRVSVQLINTKDDSYSWTQTWDKKLKNIFLIQDEISKIVAQKLELEITDNFINSDNKVDPEAYRLYLKAKYEMRNFVDEQNLIKAEDYLNQSMALDSLFAPSWSLLSVLYHKQNVERLMTLEQGYKKSKNAAYKALEIDSTYATVYDILATIAIDYEKDYDKAQRMVDKGLSIEPQNSDVILRASEVAMIKGNIDKAIKFNERLVALNPLDEASYYNLGNTYYAAKKFKKAEKHLNKSLELDPSTILTNYKLSLVLMYQNRLEEALETIKKEPLEYIQPQVLSMIYYAKGDQDKANTYLDEIINKHEEELAYQIACIYAYHNKKDEAFLWLDKAIQYKDFGVVEAITEPTIESLKNDVRWQTFLANKKAFINKAHD